METNNYELFLIAVPVESDLNKEFYDFMCSKANGCMVGAIYLENIDEEKLKETMANIVREGVRASGIQAD